MNDFDWIEDIEVTTKIMAIIEDEWNEKRIGWFPDKVENITMMKEWKEEMLECANVKKVTIYKIEEI